MSQATPNTQNQNQHQDHLQNQNQSQGQAAHEGQPGEQAKAARPRRARRPASGAKPAATATAGNAGAGAATAPAAAAAPAPAESAAHAPQTPAQPQAAQQPRARRARRPAQSQTPTAQTAHTEPATQAASPAQPAPVQTPAAQAELPPPPQPVAALPPAESAEAPAAQQKKRTTRGGRGHRGGRKNEVQLVKPAESTGEQQAATLATEPAAEAPQPAEQETPALAAQEAGAEAEPRVVPVVTEAATAAAPLTAEPATTAAPARAASRFRFGRRTGGTSPESAPAPAPAREPAPMAALAAPAAAAEPAFEAPAEEEEEPWQATVAEIAVEPLPNATETRAASAVDDLVAALGLQGASPNAPAPMTAAPEVGDADEAMRAEEAAAEEAHAEAEAEEEHQGTRRRRRRRGKGTSSAATSAEETAAEPLSAPEWAAERELRNGYERPTELSQPYSPYNRPPRERLAPVTELEHHDESAFGSPEPQMARGFGPQPRGVAGPAPSSLTRPARERERLEPPPISPTQLGNVLTHAIQQQTDRLLSELHRQPQGPAMTVAVPLPSTERVGIFVDVANLHYSARSQRITLDFGRLLDFLRGNRRLIRAHAYAPTNPEPGAEQSFLNAVRGLGYRITTKNFKTFASGAKKADMDLDMCMDIVRMVDAGALDTVVLVSGDSDFLPLLEYASDKGVRVEVAAFEDAAAMILRQSCDLFINLSLVEGLQK